jgi:two-component system NarL family sensor kinase
MTPWECDAPLWATGTAPRHGTMDAMLRRGSPGTRLNAMTSPVAREVLQFVAALLLVTVAIGVAAVIAVRQNASAEAESLALAITENDARSVIQPSLADNLVNGDGTAIATLDRVVRSYVLDQRIIRVKLWSAEGRILYSDEPALIGQQYALGVDDIAALRSGSGNATVSDLSKSENRFERGQGSLLEVYQGVRTPNRTPLLFETYQPVSAVSADEQRIWSAFLPLLLAGLVLLLLAQVPLVWRLAHRLDRTRQQREAFYERSLTASAAERRRVAADLHDTVVQDIASTKLRLAMAAERLRHRPSEQRGPGDEAALISVLDDSAGELGRATQELRTLIVALAPRHLAAARFGEVLEDLCAPLRDRGIAVELDVSPELRLTEGEAGLLFRVTQELLRNVLAHAHASHVAVTLREDETAVTLLVRDDGRGLEAGASESSRLEGHLGLTLLADTVTDAGGELEVTSVPGQGTEARLLLRRPR